MTRNTYTPPATEELLATDTEAGAVAALALAQEPVISVELDDDAGEPLEQRVYGRAGDGASIRLEVVDLEKLRDRPRAVTGRIKVHTPEALVAYADRHLDADASTLWLDAEHLLVSIVLNDHVSDTPGWADHRAECRMVKSPEFQKWEALNECGMSQEQFGDFLEERLTEVVDPDGSTMLEVARTFQATTNASFSRSYVDQSGQVQLSYREEIEGKAGKNGSIEPPAEFTIAVRPFEGTDPVRIRGLFRYRVNSEKKLVLSYRLLNLDEVLREAFDQVAGYVVAETDLVAIEGVAPEPRR